jgi:hypothetical protein
VGKETQVEREEALVPGWVEQDQAPTWAEDIRPRRMPLVGQVPALKARVEQARTLELVLVPAPTSNREFVELVSEKRVESGGKMNGRKVDCARSLQSFIYSLKQDPDAPAEQDIIVDTMNHIPGCICVDGCQRVEAIFHTTAEMAA